MICFLPGLKGQIMGTQGEMIFEDSITFWPLHDWIALDTLQSNIWQIGIPAKTYFNSAYDDGKAILTDSAGYYGNNHNDCFYFIFPWHYTWGEGILSFYHKFETDTLTDGGVIELSYDAGSTWINVHDDLDHIATNFIGLYEDTIRGGEYGFSGRSNGWQYVELYWFWIALVKSATDFSDSILVRFRFKSDDMNTGKDGWMIDEMVFRGYQVTGSTLEYDPDDAGIYPVPTTGIVNFKTPASHTGNSAILLYNSSGEFIERKEILNNQTDLSGYKPGIYFFKLFGQNEGFIAGGKLIKK